MSYHLTEKQKDALVDHLESNVYLTAKEICSHVLKRFKVNYTSKGMTNLLHSLGFRYILILSSSRLWRELLRMSYTERNSNVKFANLFRFGIKNLNIFLARPTSRLS
ncbi:MAG: winged helix-turn-helix domain-containing protein [Bacteroidetes bacterium]|nr:winged helix-turn-helix domain-containing protein [Bacteroidota bacterium]